MYIAFHQNQLGCWNLFFYLYFLPCPKFFFDSVYGVFPPPEVVWKVVGHRLHWLSQSCWGRQFIPRCSDQTGQGDLKELVNWLGRSVAFMSRETEYANCCHTAFFSVTAGLASRKLWPFSKHLHALFASQMTWLGDREVGYTRARPLQSGPSARGLAYVWSYICSKFNLCPRPVYEL